jgi:hypothetical protein
VHTPLGGVDHENDAVRAFVHIHGLRIEGLNGVLHLSQTALVVLGGVLALRARIPRLTGNATPAHVIIIIINMLMPVN